MKKKKILILLTQHDDKFSQFLRWVTQAEYTHASIAIEEDLEQFYTFNKASGFYIEKPSKIYTERKRVRKCSLYSIEVDRSVYEEIRSILYQFEQEKAKYKYNLLGVIMSFFKFSWNRENHYFCSQFVVDVLKKSGAMEFEKHPSLYLPNDFIYMEQLRLSYSGTLGNLLLN